MIDARRGELLKSAEAGDRLGDPRELVEILVRPLAEQATVSGSHYVRFLDRVFEYIGHDVTALPGMGGLDEAVAVGHLVTARLPGLTRPRLRPRIRWAGQLIISALADLEGSQETASPDELDAESYVAALIDAVAGMLTAAETAGPANSVRRCTRGPGRCGAVGRSSRRLVILGHLIDQGVTVRPAEAGPLMALAGFTVHPVVSALAVRFGGDASTLTPAPNTSAGTPKPRPRRRAACADGAGAGTARGQRTRSASRIVVNRSVWSVTPRTR
ncbi:hypothetical protein ACGF8B_15505 [Streptomyces sp. NPDC047917]|uniref:hypothetical protein n=1 Tax=Streptomyces sp. NPDC047917 TaxID=3365491 RepID=UPI003714F757